MTQSVCGTPLICHEKVKKRNALFHRGAAVTDEGALRLLKAAGDGIWQMAGS